MDRQPIVSGPDTTGDPMGNSGSFGMGAGMPGGAGNFGSMPGAGGPTGTYNGGVPGQPYTAAFSQPITSPQGADMGQMAQPVQMAQPMQAPQVMPGMQGSPGMPTPQMQDVQQNPLTGAPMMMAQAPAPVVVKSREVSSLLKTIAIVALSLVSVTFIGLFIWMFVQYDKAKTDVEGQIAVAVVEAVDENTTKLETEFTEREKHPYKTFAGPADYGELTFEYPKTWSVYVAADASKGGDFEAYLNPLEVNVVSDDTIDALRVKILNTAYDDVIARYQGELEGDEPKLSLMSVAIGKDSNIIANRYTGIIPGTEFNGIIVVFKLRDKTVVLQTDSVVFEGDFNTLLSTVTFNA